MSDQSAEKSNDGHDMPKLSQLSDLVDQHHRFQQAISGLQDALDQLRVMIKYQAFDLEATQRENAGLRTEVSELQAEIAKLLGGSGGSR